jgi:hypothetical protein
MTVESHDPNVAALLAYHRASDPEALIERLCAALLDKAGVTVPVDLDVLASYRNAEVRIMDQDQPESIVWDGKRFLILLRREDSNGRRRFSCAHAIVHTYFMQVSVPAGTGARVQNSWSQREESLCDLGAASLLLPRQSFMAAFPDVPTMDDVLDAAGTFEASAEATAIRAVTLSAVPMAMVVLEPRLKPTEVKLAARRRTQPSFPGMDYGVDPVPKLRVQRSYGWGLKFIPKHKAVDDSSPLADVTARDAVDYVGECGLLPGKVRVSARRLPIRYGNELVDRVVALIVDVRAEQARARTSRQRSG